MPITNVSLQHKSTFGVHYRKGSPGQLGLRVDGFPGHWVAGSQKVTQFRVWHRSVVAVAVLVIIVNKEQCRINANRGPCQLFSRAPLLTRDKDLSQLYSHSSRHYMLAVISSRYQYGPFLFFVAEVMSNYLTTDGLKNFSLLPEAPLMPGARGICHL